MFVNQDGYIEATVEEVRELVYLAAGAATMPLLEDHPDYVFPSERVVEAVDRIWVECTGCPDHEVDALRDGRRFGRDISHDYAAKTAAERARSDAQHGVPWREKVAKGLGVDSVPKHPTQR